MSDKLAKLVLMLSSDQHGEVFAAARAIGKHLKNEGTDWHDLAAKLSAPPPPKNTPKPTAPKKPPTELDALMERVGRMLGNPWTLTTKEFDFLWSIEESVEKYADRARITPKQQKWIDDIYKRFSR